MSYIAYNMYEIQLDYPVLQDTFLFYILQISGKIIIITCIIWKSKDKKLDGKQGQSKARGWICTL